MKKQFVLCFFLLLLVQPAICDTPGQFELLKANIEKIAESIDTRWGIYIKNIDSGEEIAVNADKPMETMSIIKIPILVEAFRQVAEGKLKLSERIAWTDERRRGGTGILRTFDSGLQPTFRDYLELMITVSDNSATDVVLEKIGGPEPVNASMRNMGLRSIRSTGTTFEWFRAFAASVDPSFAKLSPKELYYKEFPESPETEKAIWKFHAEEKHPFGLGSPRDIGKLLEMILNGKVVSAEASKQMLGILRNQLFMTRIPRYLPAWWNVPHKTGDFPPYLGNDAGVIEAGKNRIVFVVFNSHFQGFFPDLENAIARMALEVYNYYSYRSEKNAP